MSVRENERKLDHLISELNSFGDDASVDLAERLGRCQQGRHARWLAYSSGGVQPSWVYRCRSAACWFCRRPIVAKWRERAADHFKGEQSANCSFATIMLARTGTLFPLQEIVVKVRRDLRNIRDAMARHRFTWNSVSLIGHVELDAFHETDTSLLPSRRREMVEGLPLVGGVPNEVIWVPHAHLCIRHPWVHRSHIADVLADHWAGAYRVHVECFDGCRTAEENAADCTSYGLKFRDTTMFSGGVILDWSNTWSAHFWSWLHGRRRGLQPIQVAVGAKHRADDLSATRANQDHTLHAEPMPMVF